MQPRADSPVAGVLMMVVAVLFIAGQEAAAKYLSTQGMPILQVIWARYTGHLALMLCLLLPRHGRSIFQSRRPVLQVGRSLLLVVDTGLYFAALVWLSLVEVTALAFVAPILVVLLSGPLLGERVGRTTILSALLGFAGVMVIVRPGLDDLGGLGWPALLILGAALAMALFNISTRAMRDMDPTRVTMVYTALTGTIAASLAVPFVWVSPSPEQWAVMGLIGILGGTGHGLLILAHERAAASTIAPFMYVQILWALGLGWLIFGALPDAYTVAGAVIIILGGLLVLRTAVTRSSARRRQR